MECNLSVFSIFASICMVGLVVVDSMVPFLCAMQLQAAVAFLVKNKN